LKVALRPTRPDDLAFVTRLERELENRGFIGQWTDEEHLCAIAEGGRREHWIIERDGVPAGYLIAYDCRHAGAGFYVKRIVVGDKSRGTGSAALRGFSERVLAMQGASCVWLLVREANARAQHVYGNLGYERFEPTAEEAARYDSAAEPPVPDSFRMRLQR
jgi:ribosomal protein S18 acetylase RimI-like enzyme